MLTALQTLVDNGLSDEALDAVVKDLLENDALEDDDDKRCCIALVWYRGEGNTCDPSDVELLHGERVRVGIEEYLVLDDDEADVAFDESLDQLLDDTDCVPGADSPYFNRDAWKKDVSMDGRGLQLAGYDDRENEYCIGKGSWYYLYRTN